MVVLHRTVALGCRLLFAMLDLLLILCQQMFEDGGMSLGIQTC